MSKGVPRKGGREDGIERQLAIKRMHKGDQVREVVCEM